LGGFVLGFLLLKEDEMVTVDGGFCIIRFISSVEDADELSVRFLPLVCTLDLDVSSKFPLTFCFLAALERGLHVDTLFLDELADFGSKVVAMLDDPGEQVVVTADG
jgi:hypothetical protein